jgi:peptidylprolyl isomerase
VPPLRFALTLIAALCALPAATFAQAAPAASAASAPAPRTTADILREAPDSAWRRPDPDDVLAMTLPSGTVWIELAQRFAPHHAANIRTLVAQHYFDGLAVLRVQDNFVAQWGDPAANEDDTSKARSLGAAAPKLQPEFSIADKGLKITRMKDRDVWAPVTGFVDGFPVAADPKTHRAWVAHCYGTIGAGRGATVDSANGAELYAVIGQSPRGLDLNITPVARVLQGMELLSSLPRGGQNMGFYDKPEQNQRIVKIERLADIPEATRPDIRVFRTDTPQWAELVESRRNRKDAWYVHKAGAIDLCNVTVPVRIEAKTAPK